MSTRGRANAIRAALERRGLGEGNPLRSAELDAALSNCLACKACASECPSNVNLGLLKAELLHARQRREGVPLRARLISQVDLLGRLGCLAPRLANAALEWRWVRRLLAVTLGFTSRRPLPPYANERFDRWFAKHRPSANARRGPVILWDDTFVRYHEPHIGRAAVAVLEAAGYEVLLPLGRKCCGRPAFSQGNLDAVARLGRHNLELLQSNAECGMRSAECGTRNSKLETRNSKLASAPVLFLEPSCWSMFAEDYRELKLPGAERVAKRCVLFEQFIDELLRREPDALRFREGTGSAAIHAHCHAKSLLDPAFMTRLAARLPGRGAALLETGCCGMAGAFGAIEQTYDLSRQVGELLWEKIRQLPEDALVVASGTSCRQQIKHLSSTRPRHMAEVLAEALLSAGEPSRTLAENR